MGPRCHGDQKRQFLKKVGVGRDLETGERASGKMKEGCLGETKRKKKTNCQVLKERESAIEGR